MSILYDDVEAMIIFEEFVDLGDGEVIDSFEFMDLLLEHGSFMAADFVFVYDVDGTRHC